MPSEILHDERNTRVDDPAAHRDHDLRLFPQDWEVTVKALILAFRRARERREERDPDE